MLSISTVLTILAGLCVLVLLGLCISMHVQVGYLESCVQGAEARADALTDHVKNLRASLAGSEDCAAGRGDLIDELKTECARYAEQADAAKRAAKRRKDFAETMRKKVAVLENANREYAHEARLLREAAKKTEEENKTLRHNAKAFRDKFLATERAWAAEVDCRPSDVLRQTDISPESSDDVSKLRWRCAKLSSRVNELVVDARNGAELRKQHRSEIRQLKHQLATVSESYGDLSAKVESLRNA